ncbi:MAG TPA: immunoglobulin domain-containing protein [Opitutus sp.]|nr:immunoglobulin domain-containing protein [Opitutus sp.]
MTTRDRARTTFWRRRAKAPMAAVSRFLVALGLGVAAGAARALENYATPYTFTTLAGTTSVGSKDGTGAGARFEGPSGVAVDADGNVYVADSGNQTIRKITGAGVVTTLAGTPAHEGATDGTGSAAEFNMDDSPAEIAVDAAGNLYLADSDSSTIRRITGAGVVTTLAGMAGIYDAVDGTGGSARFAYPTGVAVDAAGNVYVADTGNDTIRKITSGGVVTTLAGRAGDPGASDGTGSSARFNGPTSVVVDAEGTIYVADSSNATIRKITSAGVVSTLAGLAGASGATDGAGASARFSNPRGVAVDGAGNVYVADSGNNTIRKITSGGVVTTLAGLAGNAGAADGTGASARFDAPDSVAVDSAGNIYVADYNNCTIRKITSAGVVTTLAGTAINTGSTDGVGSDARFDLPEGVAAGDGAVYVADTGNHTIRKITSGGAVSTLAGSPGDAGASDGTGPAARFDAPGGLAVSAPGDVYVADTGNDTIRRITSAGVVTTFAGAAGLAGSADGSGAAARFNAPMGIAMGPDGILYVADTGNHTIRKITSGGVVSTLAGLAGNSGSADGAGTAARFNGPQAVAVDGAGNVYVADTRNNVIRKITSAGVVTTWAGAPGVFNGGWADGTGSAAKFWYPAGVAADAAGNVYVSDGANELIRRISNGGVVTTLAGKDEYRGATDGDGIEARFNDPVGIAVDAAGAIYVADTSSSTIRKGVVSASLVPQFTTQPAGQAAVPGTDVTLAVAASGDPAPIFQWQRNGSDIAGATGPMLQLADLRPGDAGLYQAVATIGGSATSAAAIVGLTTTGAVIGSGIVLGADILHPNGNRFDQVLLTGAAEAIANQGGRITRTSFIDLNDDIVQVEFSGPGTLAVVLDDAAGPAQPLNYNQAVDYMKGHAGIVITGANGSTNVSVFTVGRATAFDPSGGYNILLAPGGTNDPAHNGSPLFQGHEATLYDGVADIAFIAVASSDGNFGGIRTANARYFAVRGLTGIYAPGVVFHGPVFIGNIEAFDAATPVIVTGGVTDARITGGDLAQDNGRPVAVSGLTTLRFTAGSDSHGKLYSARANQAVLEQDGVNVTSEIVVNPTP